jgi:hypothetical protein
LAISNNCVLAIWQDATIAGGSRHAAKISSFVQRRGPVEDDRQRRARRLIDDGADEEPLAVGADSIISPLPFTPTLLPVVPSEVNA